MRIIARFLLGLAGLFGALALMLLILPGTAHTQGPIAGSIYPASNSHTAPVTTTQAMQRGPLVQTYNVGGTTVNFPLSSFNPPKQSDSLPPGVPEDWWTTVQENIRREE